MFERLFNYMFNKENKSVKTIYSKNREIINKYEMKENKKEKSILLSYFDNENRFKFSDEYDFICEKKRIECLQSFRSC